MHICTYIYDMTFDWFGSNAVNNGGFSWDLTKKKAISWDITRLWDEFQQLSSKIPGGWFIFLRWLTNRAFGGLKLQQKGDIPGLINVYSLRTGKSPSLRMINQLFLWAIFYVANCECLPEGNWMKLKEDGWPMINLGILQNQYLWNTFIIHEQGIRSYNQLS